MILVSILDHDEPLSLKLVQEVLYKDLILCLTGK